MKNVPRLITYTWLFFLFFLATGLQAASTFSDQVYIKHSPISFYNEDTFITSISPTGEQTLFLGPDPQLNGSNSIIFNQAGTILYMLQYNDSLGLYQLVGYSADAVVVDEITLPDGIGRSASIDSSGIIYVSGNDSIYSVDPATNNIKLFVTFPQSISASDMTHDSKDNLYITDFYSESVFKITPTGSFSNFANNTNGVFGATVGITYDTNSDSIWFITTLPFDPARIYRFTTDGAGGLYAEVGNTPGGDVRTIAIYYDGLPLVPSPTSDTVVKVDAAGNLTDIWGPGLTSPTSIVFNPNPPSLTIDINALEEPLIAPVTITGNATAVAGIASVQVAIRDQQTNLWWRGNSWGDWQLNSAELISEAGNYASWAYNFDSSGTVTSGEYRVFARIKDDINRLSDPATENFEAEDSTIILPQTLIISPQADEIVTSPVNINGSAIAENGVATVWVGIRDQLTGKWWRQGDWGDWLLYPVDVFSNNTSATQVDWSTEFDPTDSDGTGNYRIFATTEDLLGIKSVTAALNFEMELSLKSTITYPGLDAQVDLPLTITGTGSAPAEVADILVGIRDQSTGLWWNNDAWGEWILNPATEVLPIDNTGTRVSWRYEFDPIDTLMTGTRQYRVFVRVLDKNSLLSNSNSLNFYGTILPADGTFEIPHNNSAVFRQDGNTLVVATDYFGLYIVDTSNALNPIITDNIASEISHNVVALIDDNTLVAIDDEMLMLYDITELDNPQLLSQLFLGETDFYSYSDLNDLTLSTDKKTAYLVSGDWTAESGKLLIVDISDTTTPTLLDSVIINSDASAVSVSSDNSLALITGRGDFRNPSSFNGMTLVDLTVPWGASIASTLSVDSEASATFSSDNKTAYLSDDSFGLQIIDLSDITNPQILGNFYDEAYATFNEYHGSGNVVLSEDESTAYLSIDSLIRSVDVSDPTQPIITGTLEAAGRPVFGDDIILSPSHDKALIDTYNSNSLQVIDFVWW